MTGAVGGPQYSQLNFEESFVSKRTGEKVMAGTKGVGTLTCGKHTALIFDTSQMSIKDWLGFWLKSKFGSLDLKTIKVKQFDKTTGTVKDIEVYASRSSLNEAGGVSKFANVTTVDKEEPEKETVKARVSLLKRAITEKGGNEATLDTLLSTAKIGKTEQDPEVTLTLAQILKCFQPLRAKGMAKEAPATTGQRTPLEPTSGKKRVAEAPERFGQEKQLAAEARQQVAAAREQVAAAQQHEQRQPVAAAQQPPAPPSRAPSPAPQPAAEQRQQEARLTAKGGSIEKWLNPKSKADLEKIFETSDRRTRVTSSGTNAGAIFAEIKAGRKPELDANKHIQFYGLVFLLVREVTQTTTSMKKKEEADQIAKAMTDYTKKHNENFSKLDLRELEWLAEIESNEVFRSAMHDMDSQIESTHMDHVGTWFSLMIAEKRRNP